MAEMWLSIEDLLAEAEKVNIEEVMYKGKKLLVHWQELKIDESPSFSDFFGDVDPEKELSKQEMMEIGEKMAEETAYRMIVKGQKSAGVNVWSKEAWERLPFTLRRDIVNKIAMRRGEIAERF